MGNSSYILSHESAYRFWMSYDRQPFCPPKRTTWLPAAARVEEFPKLYHDLCNDIATNKQLHLLTNTKGSARQNELAVYHHLDPKLPASAFRYIDDQLIVCSPWLCLAQLSLDSTQAGIAEHAMNLCGQFAYQYNTSALPVRPYKIASLGQMANQLQKYSYIKGSQTALASLRFAADGSRSPMETKTLLLLCLPIRLGGYGLPLPKMNYSITPGNQKSLVNQQGFQGDLCWKKSKIILEYNGKEFHQDIARDNRRRNDLEALGWSVSFVYWETIANMAEFDRLARQIANRIEHRIRKSNDWFDEHIQLRKILELPIDNGWGYL